jgi:hypothetical protein
VTFFQGCAADMKSAERPVKAWCRLESRDPASGLFQNSDSLSVP